MILSLSGCGAGVLSIRRRIGSVLALGSGNLRGPGVGISGDGDGVITPPEREEGSEGAAATSGLPALSDSKAFSIGGLSLTCIA